MELEDLRIYQMSMDLADKIWRIVSRWNYFEKDTIGKQLVRAGDSIGANLSEGFGRFHYKENKNFCYFSRGSLYETKTWIHKAYQRDLIKENDYQEIKENIRILSASLNSYINSIGEI
jgi:four helix bundle protein